MTNKQKDIIHALRNRLIKIHEMGYYYYIVPCNVRRNNIMRVSGKELEVLRKKGAISGWKAEFGFVTEYKEPAL